MSDYYVEQSENARIGLIGSDRMALGLSSVPNHERGDMDKVRELRAEIAALREENARLQAQVAAFSRQNDEDRSGFFAGMKKRDAEIAALREVVSLQGSALREIRIRLHAAGRRPEECYEMSILDDTIAAVRRALEEKP